MALCPAQLPGAAVQAMDPHLTSDMFLPPPVTRYRQQCEMAAQKEEAHMVLDFAERLNYNLGKVCDSVSTIPVRLSWQSVGCASPCVRCGAWVRWVVDYQSSADVSWARCMLDPSRCADVARCCCRDTMASSCPTCGAALLVYGIRGLVSVLLGESVIGQIMVCATAELLRCLGQRSLDSECLIWCPVKVSCGPVYEMWALCCFPHGCCGLFSCITCMALASWLGLRSQAGTPA